MLSTSCWLQLSSLSFQTASSHVSFPSIYFHPCTEGVIWVKDFRHCVTQLSDVIGGGRDVSSGSAESSLNLWHYHWLIRFTNCRSEDVEMLARFLPDLRNVDISGIEMSQGLLGAILPHLHHRHCTALKGCNLLSSKQHISLPFIGIVVLWPYHWCSDHACSYICDMMHCM